MNRRALVPAGALTTILACALLLGIAYAEQAPATAPSDAPHVPDFGLMFNNDGDLSFTGATPAESVRNLRLLIDSLAGTPVRTLMYSVGAGSDVLYYPTKVASVWGWRKTRYDADPAWVARIAKNTAGLAAGIDAVRVAGEHARRLGLTFVPSYRMNDDHFMEDPLEYPLTGEFWMKNRDRYCIGQSLIPPEPRYGHLLDFSHPEVRKFRLAVIFEVIDRYQDLMEGIELDFNRVQIFFPPGKADQGAPLITDMVRTVRRRLDEIGNKNGKPYWLFVRVPPALRNCRWAGLEVETWMKDRLVDVVIPAQLMTLAHDMPVDEFVAIAAPAGCKVCPSLYPRTAYVWPFADSPSLAAYSAAPDRRVTSELIRGAASNYWAMGAAGFQLFNFGLPTQPWSRQIMRDLAHPSCLSLADRIYAVTPAYYLDYQDTYQYKKQLPLDLSDAQTHDLTLIVGEDFAGATVTPAPDYCALRFGFREAAPDLPVHISLNGHVLHSGPMQERLTPVGGKIASWGSHPPPATAYLQVTLDNLKFLQRGKNRLTVGISRPTAERKTLLVEAQLGVMYKQDPFTW